MHKDEVDQNLQESWERVDCIKRLQGIVTEVESNVPGARTKEMMYELIDMVLLMGERVHDLEMRIVSLSEREQLEVQSEKIRVDVKKQEMTNLYRQKRNWKLK